jgi:hypothetical protein
MYFDAFELHSRLRWNYCLIQIEESDSFEPSTLLVHRLIMHFYVLYIKETNFNVELSFNNCLIKNGLVDCDIQTQSPCTSVAHLS